MRTIDNETICVPHRANCIRAVDKNKYENIPGSKTVFRLKHHKDYFIVRTWLGLGDVLYQRIFIKELHKQYKDRLVLKTPWAELFPDIKLANQYIYLQAQSKNVEQNKHRYMSLDYRANLKLGYATEKLKNMSMIRGIEENTFKLQNFDMDLKIQDNWMQEAQKLRLPQNAVILYWPTLRYDWHCPERNPDSKYFQYIVDNNKDCYFVVISYLRNIEKYEQEPQNVQARYEHGELHYTTILALLKMFPSVVRPSFTLPAAIAVGGRALCLYGGHFPPSVLTDARMNLQNLCQVSPTPFTDWKCKTVNKNLNLDQVKEGFKWLISSGT